MRTNACLGNRFGRNSRASGTVIDEKPYPSAPLTTAARNVIAAIRPWTTKSDRSQRTAVNMISTAASAPMSPVPTVARAGKSFLKISRYAAFMSWNFVMSGR